MTTKPDEDKYWLALKVKSRRLAIFTEEQLSVDT